MTHRILRHVALGIALALPLAACDDDPMGARDGRLTILLTDAPGEEITQATVTISRVVLQGDAAEEDGGAVLLDEPFTQDLLELENDLADLVDEASVPGGTYAQLRFVIPDACIVVTDPGGEGEGDEESRVYATSDEYTECGARDGSLQTPSFDQSGLKVNLPGGSLTMDGGETEIVADFDVAESFGHQAGASGMWVMRPVIHATALESTGEIEVAVELADTVELPDSDGEPLTLADFSVALEDAEGNEEGTLELADPDEDGVFEVAFRFLTPSEGPFSLTLVAPDGVSVTTDPELPMTADPGAGETETVEVTVTSAEG